LEEFLSNTAGRFTVLKGRGQWGDLQEDVLLFQVALATAKVTQVCEYLIAFARFCRQEVILFIVGCKARLVYTGWRAQQHPVCLASQSIAADGERSIVPVSARTNSLLRQAHSRHRCRRKFRLADQAPYLRFVPKRNGNGNSSSNN
jgi:hypothetical protein